MHICHLLDRFTRKIFNENFSDFKLKQNYLVFDLFSELSRFLKHKANEPIEARVSKMLKGICREENFKTQEYSSKQMKEACEHLISMYNYRMLKHLNYRQSAYSYCL